MASFTYLGGGCACSREKCSADCATYRSYMPKPVTNVDRIRSMSDEELVDWYFDKFFPCVPYCSMLQDGCPEHDDCKICLLEWLKQVADKDGEC